MQKLSLNQSLQQRLSPQQIQFIKLLQIPTAELEARIEEELEINPALEDSLDEIQTERERDDDSSDGDSDFDDGTDLWDSYEDREIDVENYLRDDDFTGYKMQGDGHNQDEDRDFVIAANQVSLTELLLDQLNFLRLNDHQNFLAVQIIGYIEDDGYLRQPLRSIANHLMLTQGIVTNTAELENLLKIIQTFEPPGVGASTLQECLLLQLRRLGDSDISVVCAIKILADFFDEFTKKHYDKIQRKLSMTDEQLKRTIKVITRLSPKPGRTHDDSHIQYLMPDFLLVNNSGRLDLSLNSKNAPELRVSRSFQDMLHEYKDSDKQNRVVKETVTFVKQKLDAAKWFIDAIKQRQDTLTRTMRAIVEFQHDFFLQGDETLLKPMILKDIATKINMDISTVSRVASSKAVQTEFGLYPLKYFFSEGIATESGEDASSREVKNILKDLIEGESKRSPLSDDKLEKILNERGYNIARRTVAKYREQLNIPVARLRKQV